MRIKSMVIIGILEDEYNRNTRMVSRYVKELALLPKGSMLIRQLPNSKNSYVYMKFREGEKVVSRYIGTTAEVDVETLRKQIARRRELEKTVRKLRQEQKDLEKLIKHA